MMLKHFSLFLFCSSCSLLVKEVGTTCGNNQIDVGEICFSKPSVLEIQNIDEIQNINISDLQINPREIFLPDLDNDGDPEILLNLDFLSAVEILDFPDDPTPFQGRDFSKSEQILIVINPANIESNNIANFNDPTPGIVIADLNADNVLDIASGNLAIPSAEDPKIFGRTATVILLEENPNATNDQGFIITTRSVLETGFLPAGIDSGDVNQDGFPDLLTSNQGDNFVSLFINNGAGQFDTTAVNLEIGVRPLDIAVGDIDGINGNDIVVTTALQATFVFFNNGAGLFSAPTTLETNLLTSSPALRDLDADGDLDLVASNFISDDISLFLNEGGIFSDPTLIVTGESPASLTVGDINNDGNLDFITPCFDESLNIFINDGQASFTRHTFLGADVTDGNVVISDVNGDELNDITFVVDNAIVTLFQEL
jgi:hypothetical protein